MGTSEVHLPEGENSIGNDVQWNITSFFIHRVFLAKHWNYVYLFTIFLISSRKSFFL